jgi:hypothetical protein
MDLDFDAEEDDSARSNEEWRYYKKQPKSAEIKWNNQNRK